MLSTSPVAAIPFIANKTLTKSEKDKSKKNISLSCTATFY